MSIRERADFDFKNRTNGDILIQRVQVNPLVHFRLDTQGMIPGGAEKSTLTLDNQISKTSDSTGDFTWLYNNTSGGYSPTSYSSSASQPGWVATPPNGWPLMGWHASSNNWFMHPQRNDGPGSAHYGCVLRWLANKGGKVKVKSRIKHAGGGFGGVHGMVVHCLRGSSGTKPDPNQWSASNKTYINSLGWNAVSGVGYTRQAFGGVTGENGPVQANLISNWHPRKLLSNATGGLPSKSQMRAWIDGSGNHTALIRGNVDRSGYANTRVSGPHYAFTGGQASLEPVRCRYIRMFPMGWHSHPSARVGAYNPTDKWGLGNNATYTSNSVWANDHHGHGAANAKLNHTSRHSNWSAASSDYNSQAGHAWIQMDFGSVKEVTSILTQGRHNYDQWVTQWLVFASADGTNWNHLSLESGGAWNPDFFEKEVTVKAGDWIDMIVEAGDTSSAYDTTYINHEIEYTKAGTGDNAQVYIDAAGWLRNTVTGNIDGMELKHNNELTIPVVSSDTKSNKTAYDVTNVAGSIKVNYKCDKLLDSGSDTAFTDAIDPQFFDVTNVAKDWYTIKHKATGIEMSLMILPDMMAGRGLRWCFSAEFGWIYIAPTLNPFADDGCWIYKAGSSGSVTQAKGWGYLIMKILPQMYFMDVPQNWVIVGKRDGNPGVANSPFHVTTSFVDSSGTTTTKLQYNYKIYNNFYTTGWGTPTDMSYVVTVSTPVSRTDPDIVKKIPPDHTRVGIDVGFGASKSFFWNKTPIGPNPGEISKSAMYKVSKEKTMSLSKQWFEKTTAGMTPETVAFMCRDNGQGGDWIQLYYYSNWKDRVNGFPVWKSLDGAYIMSLKGSSNSRLYWHLEGGSRTWVYRPDDGMKKDWHKIGDDQYYVNKFPSEGSYYYRHKNANIKGGGSWVPTTGPSTEIMFYFVYHPAGKRSAWRNSLKEIPTSGRGNQTRMETTGRPDLRSKFNTSSSFGYLKGFDYEFTTLNDSKGPDVQSNSRLILMLMNCDRSSGDPSSTETVPVVVRETSGTIDLTHANGELSPGTSIQGKLIYPGYPGTHSYGESTMSRLSITPAPELNVNIYPVGVAFNQNGFVMAGAKYHKDTMGSFIDCGYDTKYTFKISGNGYTETIGNVPPETNLGPNKSGQAWLGLDVQGGSKKVPGEIKYNGEKLTEGQYTLTLAHYGDQDSYTWLGNSMQKKTFQVTRHLAGHLGARFFAYAGNVQDKNDGGYDEYHTLMYGGNSDYGTWNTTHQCCDNGTGVHVTTDKNCLDFKTPVLKDPDQIMRRDARNSSRNVTPGKWEVINVRYVDSHGWRDGPIQWRQGSGPYRGYVSPYYRTHYHDNGGPTRLEFHNWHPYSDVIMRVRARLALSSNDGTGVVMGVWSTTRGQIHNPWNHNNGYLFCSWNPSDNPPYYNMYPRKYPGNGLGSTTPNGPTGAWAGQTVRSSHSQVIADASGNALGDKVTKDFGYWTIKPGEKMTFQLFAAVNISCHHGWGELEGCMSSWMEMTPHSWPQDPD